MNLQTKPTGRRLSVKDCTRINCDRHGCTQKAMYSMFCCPSNWYYCKTHWNAPRADGGPSAAEETGYR